MWNFSKTILKMILTVIIIFLIPFILPIITKLLISLKLFDNIDEFKNILSIFNNLYIIFYVCIGICILLWFFHKWTDIKDVFKNIDWSFAFGDKRISAKHINEEMQIIDEQKEFMNKISKEDKSNESENIIQEVKNKLGINEGKKTKDKNKCKECNKEELNEENSKLRYFATYNIINTDTRSLLHIMYNEKFVASNDFKKRIVQGYKRRNKKNVKFSKQDIEKIANEKYNAIFEGLKFLNIIEPSEDDEMIKLTQNGKKFVESYIERKEVV